MRGCFVKIVLLSEDDVLCGQWNAIEVNELAGENEPLSVAVAVEQQDLLVFVLALRNVADLRRNISQQIADVALHDLGLAVANRLNHKRLIETDDSHEVVAETGLEDVEQLL